MSKTIQVKVKTVVLVEALKKALAERAKRFADNAKREAEYEKAEQAYNANLMKLVKAGKGKLNSVSTSRKYGEESTVSATIWWDIPLSIVGEAPQRPTPYREWEWNQDREALEQAIRVLEMTDDEFVSAGTVKSVAQYL